MNKLEKYGIKRYTGIIDYNGFMPPKRVESEDGQYYLVSEIDEYMKFIWHDQTLDSREKKEIKGEGK